MNPEAVWTARSEADLLREFARREEAIEGGGLQLLDLVDSAIRLLRVNPEMAPRYSERYRRLILRDRRLGVFSTVEARGITRVTPPASSLCSGKESRHRQP